MGASRRSIVVIGASAGGVEALTRLVADLPGDLPAAVVVVVHLPPSGTSVLPEILDRHGDLPAEPASQGAPLRPGHIYVAPPDNHVLVRDGEFVLDRGPRQNGHRPAVDPLFETAARTIGAGVVGVILSGTLDDGAAGLHEVKLHGGVTVVQDPDDALYPSMPANAIERGSVDHVVSLAGMGELIGTLVSEPTPPDAPPAPDLVAAAPPMQGGELAAGPEMAENMAAGLSCPECGGTLWSVGSASMPRFRCRIGHQYSDRSLLEEQGRALEGAMWTAVRALEERAALLRRMANRAREAGHDGSAARFAEHAEDLDRRAQTVRVHIVPSAVASDPEPAAEA